MWGIKISLKALTLKEAYSSDTDDPLEEFYIPVLKESIHYDRLSGFFSSQSLAIAARGISGIIKNGGHMRLIVSPKLNIDDVKVIQDSYENPTKYLEQKMLNQLENLEDEFVKDHLFALGWMIANNKLEIRIALPYDNGRPLACDEIDENSIFHMKVGVLEDSEGNTITFSGSLNESAKGWLGGYIGHTEEFKVFRNWVPSDLIRLNSDIQKFERFWYGLSKNVKTIDVPEAVRNKLISIAPSNFESINLDKWYGTKKLTKVRLFDHQMRAVESWFKHDMKGIFEMATGTGKTITALECVDRVITQNKGNLLIIICAPYHHLITQWEDNIKNYGINVDVLIADGTNTKYRKKLSKKLLEDSIPYKKSSDLIVLTTHNTFSSDGFINIIQSASARTTLMLVADEVHWLGADKLRNGLLESYKYRLGLSATPKRWFDDEGTKKLYEYFNETDEEVHFSFTLEDAITKINPMTSNTYLTPYYYYPYFVNLSDEELEEYEKLTLSIIWLLNKSKVDSESNNRLQNLLFKRSNIVKNANEKLSALGPILNDVKKHRGNIDHTIIYCSDKQIDNISNYLSKNNFIYNKFTMNEGVMPSEIYSGISQREHILKMFDEGRSEILVAMKCLDEGVDIPSAKNAVLLANDGNPRQYVQRLGRILRRSNDKNYAIIIDVIVIPNIKKLNSECRDIELKILEKELKRYWEIAKLSKNSFESQSIIAHIQEKICKY